MSDHRGSCFSGYGSDANQNPACFYIFSVQTFNLLNQTAVGLGVDWQPLFDGFVKRLEKLVGNHGFVERNRAVHILYFHHIKPHGEAFETNTCGWVLARV